MKAILLNSADKMAGVQGSDRTVLDSANQNWEQSEAFSSVFQPLDNQLGAGHLNARRAVQQLTPGEYDPGTVPAIGWDFGSVNGEGSSNEYILDQAVQGGDYISITLTWDRRVESTGGNVYNSGDTFFSQGLANLDVFLVDAASNDPVTDAIWASESFEDNVEHIFFKFGAGNGGNYKIVVQQRCCSIGNPLATTNYGLAWWSGGAPSIPGDHNKDGSVNAADYVVWRNDPASFGGAGGYDTWRANFGNSSGAGSSAIPEPSSVMLLLAFLSVIVHCRTRS